jgi:hypothetical protein
LAGLRPADVRFAGVRPPDDRFPDPRRDVEVAINSP